MDRVYGPDLMLALAERAAADGWTHFFYGGEDGVADRSSRGSQARFPGFGSVGTYSPPFRPLTPEEDAAIVERINALGRGHRLGRPEHAEAGALDGRPRRPAAAPRC